MTAMQKQILLRKCCCTSSNVILLILSRVVSRHLATRNLGRERWGGELASKALRP